jgi:hypothetical protein
MNSLHIVGLQPKKLSNYWRISPYLWAQHGLLQKYHLPIMRDLPPGTEFRARTFDFGFNPGNAVLAPYDTQYQSITQARNFLIWGINGASAAGRGQIAASPAYLFNVVINHAGDQQQFFNKTMSDIESAGTAQEPFILTSPQLVLAGDQMTVQIQNLGNINLAAQVVLLGGEF